MNVPRWDFLLLVTLAATAATPAIRQDAVPAIRAASNGAQSAASIPDFSGIWAHPSLGFEPPLSGPGPVLNKSRLPTGQSNLARRVGDYTNPILKPEAAAVVKKHGEISLAGVAFPTPNSECWPEGLPYIFWNMEIQMLQQPHEITILYWFDHQVRHVRMNQSHPASVTPSWYGDSVGHYEGDTLVIDTVGIRTDRPVAMVDTYGTPQTRALHVVERYRLLDCEAAKEAQERGEKENLHLSAGLTGFEVDPNYKGSGLQLQLTVEDDGVFTMPWSATVTYRRALGEWLEYVCAENTHEYYSGKDAAVTSRISERGDERSFGALAAAGAISLRLPFFGIPCHPWSMIVIGTDVVETYFADHAGHKRMKAARSQYEAWLDLVTRAEWRNPEDVKASYPKASILKAGRVVFNIKGNDYRLIARVQYQVGVLAIRFFGRHAEYEMIDAETV
jgi:mRNA interferase HigB